MVFSKKSTKKATKKYSYGYKRFSLLGAIINSIVLVIGSVFIIKEAIPRVINPENADAKGMMWLAVLGIIVNGAAVLKLKKGTSINERVVSLHLLEDVLGWGVVLIASIVMQFWDVPVLDPVLSIAIAGFVLYNVYKNIKESLRVILQGTPENISVEEIQQRIVSMKDVEGIHDCHLWTMDGEYNVFTAHLVLKDKEVSWEKGHKIKQEIKQVLHDDFHLEHITLELEFTSQECDYENCGS
nr:cation diffusion facilitator family transporter [Tenacibaculum mesophilum]